MKNIALVSPNDNSYSETFIQQHKEHLNGNIIYYFDGGLPKKNNVEGRLLSKRQSLVYKIQSALFKKELSLNEQALKKSFKKNKIDVVVAEYGTTAARLLNVCSFLGIPLVPIFHGYDASIEKVLETNKSNYKALFVYAKTIIAVSYKIKATLIEMGCNPSKVVVSPCAPCDSFFNLNPKFESQQFLAVGRFTDKKAPYYTILAFKEVLKKYPAAVLKMGGGGVLFNACKNLINYYNLENNVQLLGVLSRKQIQKEIETSVAFVQHSIVAQNGDSEGTPVAILEASAAGIPVVSTNHAGIPDVILDGTTGFLVEEHDVKGMAEKMLLLLSDKKLCKTLGDKARDRVKQNFSLRHHIGKIDAIVKSVLEDE